MSRQKPYGVSVDDVTVRASHFVRRYRCLFSIVIALSISSDGCFLCVTQPASEKGEGSSTTNASDGIAHFFLAEILYVQNLVAKEPFNENRK